MSGTPRPTISSPKAALMMMPRLLMETDLDRSSSPSAWATSVCVLIPRKLKDPEQAGKGHGSDPKGGQGFRAEPLDERGVHETGKGFRNEREQNGEGEPDKSGMGSDRKGMVGRGARGL